MGLKDLAFGGSVKSKTADISGEKIDTNANNEEEQETQDKVEDAMESDTNISNDDIDADTSSEDSDDDSEEEEDEDSEDEESEDDDESESDDDSDDEESDSDDKPAEDEAVEKPAEETQKVVSEQEISSQLLAIEKNEGLTDEAREEQVMSKFIELNSDIIPESARVNFQKFIDSGRNNAFLMADDSLYKLVMAVRDYKDDLPLSERLSKASKIVFSDKISNRDKNRGKVEAEVKAQKVNKAVEKPRKSVSGKTKPGLSTEQKDVFRRMGVPLKNHKKYGKL